MCGGEGSRLRAGGVTAEKPLVTVGGRPMLDRICTALVDSRIETVYAAVSPAAPSTREHARDLPCTVVETPGEGYVADLHRVLADVGRPVLTVAADLPLLTAPLVNRVLAVAERAGARTAADRPDETAGATGRDRVRTDRSSNRVPSVTVCVPVALKRQLGASVDTTIPSDAVDAAELLPDSSAEPPPELAPSGVNVVADAGNATWVSRDARLAVNVNRPDDLALAENLCS